MRRSAAGSAGCRYRRLPRRRHRPRANLVAARALHARRRTPPQCPCDFPRDGEKDLPQWDCDKHYRYKRKGRFSQDAAARTLDGGQVRSHKITPTRLGFIRLIYETSVEKIALPPGAHRPADCGWPCASLPRPVVVALAKIFGALASLLDRYGRRIALANLDCAFGQKYSASEKRRIVRESYQHFAQTMLDLMWSPRLTPENFSRYIDLRGFPRLAIRIKAGLLSVITTAISNGSVWAADFRGRTGTIVAQEFKNPLLDPIFRRWREQSGHVFTARTGGILRLYKTLRRGGNTAMLVDLTVFPGPSAVAIRSFRIAHQCYFRSRLAAATLRSRAYSRPLRAIAARTLPGCFSFAD